MLLYTSKHISSTQVSIKINSKNKEFLKMFQVADRKSHLALNCIKQMLHCKWQDMTSAKSITISQKPIKNNLYL